MAALIARLAVLWLLALCLPAQAQAQATLQASLDRDQLVLGEVATLTIRAQQAGEAPDLAPLERDFLVYAPTLRRHSVMRNGQFTVQVEHSVGIEPRRSGLLTVPPLRVGAQWTPALALQVAEGDARTGQAPALAFIRTRLDTGRPWVHQSVGVVVALYYATALASGELVQEAPEGAGLQRVGDDRTDQAVVDGRHYNVVERRYLLLPERSGALPLPPARFRGRVADGGRGRLISARQDPAVVVQVQPQPAAAASPWLPAHGLSLRWEQVPLRVAAGQGVELLLVADIDGASRAQIDTLPLPAAGAGYRLYPQATEVEERFDGDRPQLRLRRRVVVVPQAPGTLTLPGLQLPWWNAGQGLAAQATLAPLTLLVGPPLSAADAAAAALPGAGEGRAAPPPATPVARRWQPPLLWTALVLLLAGCTLLAAGLRRRRRPAPVLPAASPLPALLATGSLQEIIDALAGQAGVAGMAGVLDALADDAQRQALAHAQQVWWGPAAGDRVAARERLRQAFATGPRWHRPRPVADVDPLPPLYR